MCERPPFWQWLRQVLFETIRAFPGFIALISSPICEVYVGLIGIPSNLILAIYSFDAAFYTRVVLALLSIPSFLLVMHGIYREGGDC